MIVYSAQLSTATTSGFTAAVDLCLITQIHPYFSKKKSALIFTKQRLYCLGPLRFVIPFLQKMCCLHILFKRNIIKNTVL